MNGHRIIAPAALLLVCACSDSSIHLGVEAPYWTADTETGDYTQWTAGGPSKGRYLSGGGGKVSIVTSPTHSGSYAVQAMIDPRKGGGPAFARLERVAPDQDAYFLVWMYIPTRYAIEGYYWNLFEFWEHSDPANPDASSAIWSLNLHQDDSPAGLSGDMMWYVYDNLRGRELRPATPLAAPVGRWFQIQAFVHQATDDTGRIAFWIDQSQEPIIEAKDIATVPTMGMRWQVGSASKKISKSPAFVYVDDASVVLAP